MGLRSPHLCQLQVRHGADQLPREGDNRLRFALERGRTAGKGQQPHSKRGQEDECHGVVMAGGLWLCRVPAALLWVPPGSRSYLWCGEGSESPSDPSAPTHTPFPR